MSTVCCDEAQFKEVAAPFDGSSPSGHDIGNLGDAGSQHECQRQTGVKMFLTKTTRSVVLRPDIQRVVARVLPASRDCRYQCALVMNPSNGAATPLNCAIATTGRTCAVRATSALRRRHRAPVASNSACFCSRLLIDTTPLGESRNRSEVFFANSASALRANLSMAALRCARAAATAPVPIGVSIEATPFPYGGIAISRTTSDEPVTLAYRCSECQAASGPEARTAAPCRLREPRLTSPERVRSLPAQVAPRRRDL